MLATQPHAKTKTKGYDPKIAPLLQNGSLTKALYDMLLDAYAIVNPAARVPLKDSDLFDFEVTPRYAGHEKAHRILRNVSAVRMSPAYTTVSERDDENIVYLMLRIIGHFPESTRPSWYRKTGLRDLGIAVEELRWEHGRTPVAVAR